MEVAGYKICATVPTGFEPGAADECREVLGDGAHVKQQRGRVSFLLPSLRELEKVGNARARSQAGVGST